MFPTDDSVRKVIYLAIKDASKKWSMPIQNWWLAMRCRSRTGDWRWAALLSNSVTA
ncbi:Mutator family Transposase [Salmonella enterica subsp. enterica serovar Agona str. 08.A.05]|nr:Mutator family Transposase [Salmonella enterica subsp. enterica serovar Agona str. 08.A.05]